MCFANRSRCKRCNKETIQYVSKCQQYPNVTAETATHAIRGRHRRIRSCKECRRTERRRAEEEATLTTVHHQQAKAILEWQRLERPLPLTDEAIATRNYMAAHRLQLAARSKEIQEALNEVEFELTIDELEIVSMVFSEDAMFDECIQRQAEIDSGARTMTESDKEFSFHEVGTTRNYNGAMDTIKSAARRNNFGTWTVDVPDRYVAEDRVRREIIAYIATLEEANADDDRIDKFINRVLDRFKKDEETFDFDPKARSLASEVPVWGRVDDRKTFCEWKNHCQQSSKRLEGTFDRWYTLINQYRKYLILVSPAQATLFSIARNTIASRMFRALTGRPEPAPLVKVPEPTTPELQSQEIHDDEPSSLDLDDYLDTDSEDDGCDMALSDTSDDESNGVEMTPARQRLQQSLLGLAQLVQISDGFIRDLPDQSNTGAAYLQQCIRFLNDQLASNSYPTEAEWEIVAQYTANAMEMLNHLNDERNARAASRQAGQPGVWREPTQEPEPFFVDLTPMEVGIIEEEPENIAYGGRHILGLLSPLRAYEWRLEEEGSEDGSVWRGETFDEDEEHF
ncbi:hypothetical protein BOTCAL_0235g00070 [Botryotinia calthae]|uniref:Uncharacterized protein n=1 Tax=Botryotinia calthae TaxID=38488 RepID=A0A4Y8CXC2_9HELO|nr:hypothetical protein BOTCAL_0235g00070 [Botryotinia calthae]